MYPQYELFFNNVKTKPKSKLHFITVKDNTQATKWVTIGKVNDWVRRYADEYIITRGKVGGVHFHMICYCNKNTNFKSPKGIHMNIKQVGKIDRGIFTDEDKQDIREAKHFHKLKAERIQNRMRIPVECLYISSIIRLYFEKQNQRAKRLEARTKYEKEIKRVLEYLHKNLLENPVDEILKYISWMEK